MDIDKYNIKTDHVDLDSVSDLSDSDSETISKLQTPRIKVEKLDYYNIPVDIQANSQTSKKTNSQTSKQTNSKHKSKTRIRELKKRDKKSDVTPMTASEISKKHIKKIKKEVVMPEFDYVEKEVNKNNIKNNLKVIYKNLEQMKDYISNYYKILFICSDYPGYGGAATNCNDLQRFFTNRKTKTFALYYTHEDKVFENKRYKIVHERNLIEEIVNLKFKPDLVILKNTLSFSVKFYLANCKVIYFIPGLFKDSLDKYYTEIDDQIEYNKYINHFILKQIDHCDYSFCNNYHVKKILFDVYKKDVNVFYSSFVKYHNRDIKEGDDFNDRKWSYGIIVSNFDRTIKNIKKCIEIVRYEDKVVLIGKNSHKYKIDGMDCIDLVDPDEIINYYKQIRYIVQDSFFESSSNVIITGLYNGCRIHDMVSSEECLIDRDKLVGFGLSGHYMNQAIKYINGLAKSRYNKGEFKILYICAVKHLILKMSRVRFWAIDDLSSRSYIQMYFTGDGFLNFDKDKTIKQNIEDLQKEYGVKFDFIMWYKPLEYDTSENNSIDVPTVIRYNEMWDKEWTEKEINTSASNIVICHHLNDQIRYDIENYDIMRQYIYNPHHCHPDIFKNDNVDRDIDILIAGVLKTKHYPLKGRLFQLINKNKDTRLKGYNIHHLKHPGYNHPDAYTGDIQRDFAHYLNRAKICISCTSKHKYRLGKYVEIPMCGSVVLGDIPYEDPKFRTFVIDVDMHMTDDQILNKLVQHLEDPILLKVKAYKGLVWAKEYVTEKYVDRLVKIYRHFKETKTFKLIDKTIDDVIRKTKRHYNSLQNKKIELALT